MSGVAAAIGVAQLERLDPILEKRREVACLYFDKLGEKRELILPTVEADTFMSWFVYVVRLTDRFTEDDRDTIIDGLRRHDVGTSNYFPPIPMLPFYRRLYGHIPGDFPVAESVSQRTIALPFFTQLTDRDVDIVCQTLELMMTRATFARS